MRKLVIVVIVLVVIIVGALLALPHLIDVNQYRGQIQTELQQRLNRPVQLGELSLGVFPLRVEANNVTIGEDPSFHSTVPFAQVSQLDVSVKLFPLLSKNIEIDSLELKRPAIELIRNSQGVWNFSTIASAPAAPANAPAPTKPQQPAKPAPSQPAPSTSNGLTLGKLQITDGQIAVTDLQKRQPRAVYDHIDLTLKDYAPGQPFSLDLTAHLPGNGSQTFSISGDGGPINNADLAGTPFKGTVRLNEVSLAGAQKFLNSSALAGTDAVISGSTDLTSASGNMSAAGSLKLENAVVHGVKVGYPISADFDVSDNLTTDVIQIRKCNLKLGSTPLSVNGTVNTTPATSIVDVNLSTSDASIQDAARLAAAFGVAFSPDANIAGQITANVHAQGPTSQMAFNGNLSARNLEMTGKQIPQPVKVPEIASRMTPQQIQSNNFTATSGSTSLAVQMTLTQYARVSPNVDATVKTINGKLNELLNIAQAYGVSAAEGMTGSGNITLDVHATGPIKNTDAMKFSGSGALQNASLKNAVADAASEYSQCKSAIHAEFDEHHEPCGFAGFDQCQRQFECGEFPGAASDLRVDRRQTERHGTGADHRRLDSAESAGRKKRADASWSLVPTADAAPQSRAAWHAANRHRQRHDRGRNDHSTSKRC